MTENEDRIRAMADALRADDPAVRDSAAQALAELRDPAAEPVLRRMLKSDDGTVRGRGAQGLDAIGADGAVAALVATINELPNELRTPFTIPVYGLIDHGVVGVAAVAPLLDDPDELTRERALLVVRMVADRTDAPAGLGELVTGYDAAVDPECREPAGPAVAAAVG